MISPKDLHDLEDLHSKGVGVREIIIAAYQVGRATELNALAAEIGSKGYTGTLIADLKKTVIEAERKAEYSIYDKVRDEAGND